MTSCGLHCLWLLGPKSCQTRATALKCQHSIYLLEETYRAEFSQSYKMPDITLCKTFLQNAMML